MRRWGQIGPAEVMPALSHGWWKGWRGPKPLTADFGDRGRGFNDYRFAFLEHGSFVLGDITAVVGPHTVTFWSATWSSQNVLSGGDARRSFKGFASTMSTNPPVCGDIWTSRPGNSSKPPEAIPAFMGVVVSSTIKAA